MSDSREHQEANPGERRRLDSWKEVAAYLGRGIRTVQELMEWSASGLRCQPRRFARGFGAQVSDRLARVAG
jgi:hypothetical protein